MAKVFIEETTLTAIGDAIRGKTGKTDLIDPANMSTEIAGIEAGGGGGDFPEEAFIITGDCSHRFRKNAWSWYLDTYASRITTKDITSMEYMFAEGTRTNIPLVLNVKNVGSTNYAFYNCRALTTCPKIRGTFSNSTDQVYMLRGCYSLRDVEDLYLPEELESISNWKWTSSYSGPQPPNFYELYSLRRVPSWWYKFRVCEDSTVAPANSYTSYPNTFYNCFSLDEVTNIPVVTTGTITSNYFSGTFNYCQRLKRVTFETNEDGSPKVAKWKTQTIDLSQMVGVTYASPTQILNYNSGITSDKRVTDDASYQALKNDPDWFTNYNEYCRYNHDSAVETINSLPDTSAYLASAGGTNTIKFKGANGSATDGGAINTLTEEEIAVATAKGWTVTFA